jgi:hypothetical protein
VVVVDGTGFVDLVRGGAVFHCLEYREGRSDERFSRGDAFVGVDAADQSKVSLLAATEGGSYGLAVCFAFFFEDGEVRVGGIADDLRQRGMLEVGLPIVYLGVGHIVGMEAVVAGTVGFWRQLNKFCY